MSVGKLTLMAELIVEFLRELVHGFAEGLYAGRVLIRNER